MSVWAEGFREDYLQTCGPSKKRCGKYCISRKMSCAGHVGAVIGAKMGVTAGVIAGAAALKGKYKPSNSSAIVLRKP